MCGGGVCIHGTKRFPKNELNYAYVFFWAAENRLFRRSPQILPEIYTYSQVRIYSRYRERVSARSIAPNMPRKEDRKNSQRFAAYYSIMMISFLVWDIIL